MNDRGVRDWPDICALVVGGSSGIGLAAADLLLERGAAAVRIAGRNAARGAAALAALQQSRPRGDVDFLAADCTEPAAAEALVAEAARRMGQLDVLVCSAGGNQLPELLFRMPLAGVRDAVQQDLLPTLLCCRAVLPVMMAAGGGAIVTVASDAAKVATPGEAVIGGNMAAIVQFTRGIAIEGRRNGIRANCVTPSLVEGTPLTERLMEAGTFSARLFAKARPLAGLGPTTARDVAEVVVFLAGPQAARITGQAVSVNGGISAA